MKRILLIGFVILPIALFVPQAFGGTEVNIKSATVIGDTLTLKGDNFDVNGGVLTVILRGNFIGCTVVNPEEVTCNISGEGLEPGTTYTVSVSAGNAPGKNDEIDVYISDGSSGACTNGAFTSCYSGDDVGVIGTGECQSGTTTCEDGSWGSCVGDVTPSIEICGDTLDTDCDGALNNGCEGQPCDDGDFCTEGDIYNASGVCLGQTLNCDDGLYYTVDTCISETGVCTHMIGGSYCVIGGTPYTAYEPNGSNVCQYCDPSSSQTTWSNRDSTFACAEGPIYCDGYGSCPSQ